MALLLANVHKDEHTVPIFNTTPFSPEFSYSPHGSLQEWQQLIVLCPGILAHTHHASLKPSQAQQTSVEVGKTLKIQSCPVDYFFLYSGYNSFRFTRRRRFWCMTHTREKSSD